MMRRDMKKNRDLVTACADQAALELGMAVRSLSGLGLDEVKIMGQCEVRSMIDIAAQHTATAIELRNLMNDVYKLDWVLEDEILGAGG